MIWGYYGYYFKEYGIPIPFNISIVSHPHGLITGASGSGKSFALLFLLGKLLQEQSDITLYFCDFKNSEDFAFLKGYEHYYSGSDCYDGIMLYYENFSKLREQGRNQQRYILICDEYPSLINYLQMKDKLNKTKKAFDVINIISELLMLGRGLSFGVWLVTQRADSTLFSGGSRDNFMIILALGKMSKEQKGMLFSGLEVPDTIYDIGEGLLLADGRNLTLVKFPLISNIEDWKQHILNRLGCN